MEKIDYILSMERIEKCKLLKQKGYTYNPETGQIFGVRGKEIKRKSNYGYIIINTNKYGDLKGHHFAWYMTYGNVDFIELDHKDKNPINNRISNLRISNRNQQTQNINCKGCHWSNRDQKWIAQIKAFGKKFYLGSFNTEVEAREAYINAKKKYHNI